MFRILIVEDDRSAAYLLQELMKNLQRRHELYFVKDGMEALDFLHCQGAYLIAPRPNLILLDVHMPRLSGLETLAAIKNDPELCIIPVIMLSTESSPEDVRRSYEAHANCYVQKPGNLERSVKLVQAVEAFWIDFAILPSCDGRPPRDDQVADSKRELKIGPSNPLWSADCTKELSEARSRAMSIDDSPAKTATSASRSGCEEHNRLLEAFGAAVQELLQLHEHQFLAIVQGDTECSRFDLLIHVTNEKKQLAKYAYLRHVESHGCLNIDALNKTRT